MQAVCGSVSPFDLQADIPLSDGAFLTAAIDAPSCPKDFTTGSPLAYSSTAAVSSLPACAETGAFLHYALTQAEETEKIQQRPIFRDKCEKVLIDMQNKRNRLFKKERSVMKKS